MRRLVGILVTIALCAIAVPAVAATRTPPISYGSSCIDGNNNGQCGDSADTPLAKALDQYGMYNDANHGSHSGVVLQGGVVFPDGVVIVVNNNVTVQGSIAAYNGDLGATIESIHGNATIAPSTTFVAHNSIDFITNDQRSNIDIGAGTTANVAGDNVILKFDSYGTLHLGANQHDTIRGGGYTDVWYMGRQGARVDSGQTFKGPNHGGYHIYANSDVTLDNVNWKSGYVYVDAINGHTIVVRNSTLNQTYKNGAMRLLSDVNVAGHIVFDHSTVSVKDVDGSLIDPAATCIASTAPAWACQ